MTVCTKNDASFPVKYDKQRCVLYKENSVLDIKMEVLQEILPVLLPSTTSNLCAWLPG